MIFGCLTFCLLPLSSLLHVLLATGQVIVSQKIAVNSSRWQKTCMLLCQYFIQWTFIEILSSNPYFFSIHILNFEALQISVTTTVVRTYRGWSTFVHIQQKWLEVLLTILFIYLVLVNTHTVILVIQATWLVRYLGLWRYIHRARQSRNIKQNKIAVVNCRQSI